MHTLKMRDSKRVAGYRVVEPDLEGVKVMAAGLPADSKWCCWRAEPDESRPKPAKVPHGQRGPIKTTIPESWLSFSDAVELYGGGNYDGIGVLMSSLPGIVGLDLDKCLAAECTVGEGREQIVSDFVALGGYVEVSPSGNGLRQFLRGTVPDGYAEKYGDLEVYGAKAKRYLTLTGVAYPVGSNAGGIVENQAGIDAFMLKWGKLDDAGHVKVSNNADEFEWTRRTDGEVLTLMLSRLNPCGKYTRLIEGDISEYAGNSEARRALMMQLAYITRDDEQIERIIRLSGLDPSKFDEKRKGYRGFLHYEVSRALKDQTQNYDADQRAKVIEGEVEKQETSRLKAKLADRLHGGVTGLLDAKGRLKGDMVTASELLIRDKKLIGVMWFDDFAGMPKKSISFAEAFGDKCAPRTAGQIEDDDLLAVSAWLRREWGVVVEGRPEVIGAVRRWARATTMNPVIEKMDDYLEAYDDIERLPTVFQRYFGVQPDNDMQARYLAEVGKRFFIAVVARATKPGTQQDQMLVLEEPEGGEGKTAAVRIIGQAFGPDTFLEGIHPEENKDCFMKMRGMVVGEWGELVGFDQRESEWIKNFITRATDTYRDPFGALIKAWPRTISFVATTNSANYLKDIGGIRRYWPVRVGRIDLQALERDIGLLIGEAVKRYRNGERFWIDKSSVEDADFRMACASEQRRRLVRTAYDDTISDLNDLIVHGGVEHPDMPGVKVREGMGLSVKIVQRMLSNVGEQVTVSDWQKLVAPALKRNGWSNEFRMVGNRTGWGLTHAKGAELRKLHDLGGPEALPRSLLSMVKRAGVCP